MEKLIEFYEANHLLVLLIVTIGFILYINSIKSKKHHFDALKPKIEIGSKLELKYILTNEIIEIEICEGVNKIRNNVHFVNHQMPLAVSLLNRTLGDIVKFKRKINDENFIYVEVLRIGNYVNEEKISDNEIEEDVELNENENIQYLVYNFSRFRVTQAMYDILINNHDLGLRIIVTPKKGNHPNGYYELPNDVAKEFIEEKQRYPNWEMHGNFHQDGIPVDLKDYFIQNL